MEQTSCSVSPQKFSKRLILSTAVSDHNLVGFAVTVTFSVVFLHTIFRNYLDHCTF